MSDFYCEEILNGNTAVDFVVENEHVVAFKHTDPFFEIHYVIVPRTHIESVASDCDQRIDLELMRAIRFVVRLAEKEVSGCRVSTNVGNYQTTRHLHFYVHAGARLRNEDGSLVNE